MYLFAKLLIYHSLQAVKWA